MYFLCLTGAGLAVVYYEKYLGSTSPVQNWLRNEYSTSYSTDIDDALFAIQDVSIAFRGSLVDRSSLQGLRELKDRVDMFKDALRIFEPNTEIGEHINTYVSTTEAMQAANA